ncbi:hypothetical protein KR067_005991 [Drosophila pandora]|nr:hypothetical protein KR067_005991 [Drosophila pandora]
MKSEYITLEQSIYPALAGGGRPNPGQKLTTTHLIILTLIVGTLLITLYGYWDVMMLTARATDPLTAELRNESLAEQLHREVRILCWVLTTPKYHKSRAVHVMRTWGKRCNKIYFMTSAPDDELPTVLLTKPDRYEVLWGKTKEAFTYLYEHKRDEADWFLKADDDTYVFLENMRYMLYPYPTNTSIYFGFNYKMVGAHPKNETYMSGGSGYVLSREALRTFVEGVNDPEKCRQEDNHAEDVEMGKCLFNLGVKAGDSRDSRLRNRFYPVAPFGALLSGDVALDFWLYKYAYYNSRSCLDCLSDYPVAFHYVSSRQLYVYDYFSYQLQLQLPGREGPEVLPRKLRDKDIVIPDGDNTIV